MVAAGAPVVAEGEASEGGGLSPKRYSYARERGVYTQLIEQM